MVGTSTFNDTGTEVPREGNGGYRAWDFINDPANLRDEFPSNPFWNSSAGKVDFRNYVENVIHENSLDYAIANKWSEFTNEYNKIAYMFGAVKKEINKYKGKKIKENKKVEVNEIDEYKGQRVKKQNDKPTLMDLIKRGNLNGK